jgi:hypothetical protein
MRHFCLTILLIVSVLSLPSYAVDPPKEEHKKEVEPALGVSQIFGRWTGPVNLVYDPDGASGISDEEFLDILKEAIGRWELVSGIKFNITGIDSEALDDSNLDRANRDGLIRVSWIEECGCAGRAGPLFDSYDYDLGYYPYYDGTLELVVSTSYWQRDSLVDLLEHELGHLIGLGHSDDPTSILYADPYNDLAYPRIDDILAVQTLYGPPAVAIDPTKPLPQWVYTPPPKANSSLTQKIFWSDPAGPKLYILNEEKTSITVIDSSVPELNSLYFRLPVNAADFDSDIDAEIIVVDPFGYVSKRQKIFCRAGFSCPHDIRLGYGKDRKYYPGEWKLYVVDEKSFLPTTLFETSIHVDNEVIRNMPPSADLNVTAGTGDRDAVFNLTVSDIENDNVSATWHIGNSIASNISSGSITKTLTFPKTGKNTIFIEVEDDGPRYETSGFQTLLRVDFTLPITSSSDVVVTSSYKDPSLNPKPSRPDLNQAPTSDAGADQIIQDDNVPGAIVTLSAVNSSDDSGIVSYSWSGSDGSAYSGISPTVNAPVGTTVYTLTVTDVDGASNTDTVSITVNAYSLQTSNGLAFTLNSPVDGQARVDGRADDNSDVDIIIPETITVNGTTYNVKSIGDLAFSDDQVTSVIIPNSVTSIGEWAFAGNQLTSVKLGNSVTSIGSVAFADNQLTSLTIPDSVISIGHSAFPRNQLAELIIPSSVTIIGDNSFAGNPLTSVTIGKNVTYIGDFAFRDGQLSSITIPDSVIEIGEYAFADNPIDSVLFKANYSDNFSKDMFNGGAGYLTTIEACDDTSGWAGKSFSNGYSDVSVTVINCSSTTSIVPDVPQQSLSKIIRTDGKATDSTISIGGSSDDGETYSTAFTVDDQITLTAKIYPDSDDVGEEGEIYVVIRMIENGKKVFKALNEDGIWEVWNASLKSLPAAMYVETLQSVEEVEIHSGTMTAGQRLIYVGYSLFTDGKPVITTSLSPQKIDVTSGKVLSRKEISLSAQLRKGSEETDDLTEDDFAYTHGDVQLKLDDTSLQTDIFLKYRVSKPEEDFKSIDIVFNNFRWCSIFPAYFDSRSIEIAKRSCVAFNIRPGEYVYSLQVIDDEDSVMQESSIIVTVIKASDD